MTIDWGRTRKFAPWIARDVLWLSQGLVLSAVSAFYSFRWALEHGFPVWIAGSLFMALELSAGIGMVVRVHPRDRSAARQAVWLIIGAAALAAIVNGLMHLMDLKLIEPTAIGVLLTGSVVVAMLAWSSHVARGMAPRPKDEDPVEVLAVAEPVRVEEVEPAPSPVVQPIPSPRDRVSVPRSRSDAELIAALRRDWQERGRRPGEDRMARTLGVSRAKVRQLLCDLPDLSVQSNGVRLPTRR